MPQDGSDGYTARQGLEAVLGGKDIEKMNRREGAMTQVEMEAYLLNGKDSDGYAEAARAFGGAVLRIAKQNPTILIKDEYEIYDEVKKEMGVDELDLTGFMVGWGINAARYAMGKPIGNNPAIVTIGN